MNASNIVIRAAYCPRIVQQLVHELLLVLALHEPHDARQSAQACQAQQRAEAEETKGWQ